MVSTKFYNDRIKYLNFKIGVWGIVNLLGYVICMPTLGRSVPENGRTR